MILLKAGDDEVLTIAIDGPDGTPLDLTGYEVRWKIVSAAGFALEKVTPTGIVLAPQTGQSVGVAYVSIDAADLASITETTEMSFEVQIKGADEKRKTPIEGQAIVRPQIITA